MFRAQKLTLIRISCHFGAQLALDARISLLYNAYDRSSVQKRWEVKWCDEPKRPTPLGPRGDQKSNAESFRGFVGLLAAAGVLGVAAPALAGSAGTGNVIYYAQTGPDSVIHCAGYNAAVGTGGGTVAGAAVTYVAKNLYCVNADSYPSNYFEARAEIINTSNVVSADTGWVWNSSPSSVTAYIARSEAGCSSSEYYTLGQNNAAVNLAWQYWADSSGSGSQLIPASRALQSLKSQTTFGGLQMKRRLIQGTVALLFGGLALLGGELVAQAASGGDAHSSTSSPGQANTPPPLPDQVEVMGPNNVVAGTVPKSDLVGQPPAATPGAIPSAASTPGALVVVAGDPGYPVTNNGNLVGYWVPPNGFMTVGQAQTAGATPADGAPAVGSQ